MFSSSYIISFAAAFFLTVIFTSRVIKFAKRRKIMDYPDGKRKIHRQPVPFLGGTAIFLGFSVVLGYFVFFTPHILGRSLEPKHLAGVFVAGLFLIIGGSLDDKYNLSPAKQVVWPILAALAVIASGIGVKYVTNPFGGTIGLELAKFHVLNFRGIPYYFSWPADIITLIWILGMIYTTKFLDGLDGLVSGITAIGSLIIFGLCLFTAFYQPEVALMAVILSGACLGFLVFNFHPAKIFLGEGGSTFCGFMLGVLAVISGGKFATALLVMGVAIFDIVWIILRRVFWERRSPFQADNKHFHFRLLDMGLSHRQSVFLLYFLSACFGAASLFLQSREKLVALGILAAVTAVLAALVVAKSRKISHHKDKVKQN